MRGAYATLLGSPDYLPGVLALARSLRRVEAAAPLLVLCPFEDPGLEALEREGAQLRPIRPLPVSEAFRERHQRKQLHQAAPFTKGEKPTFHDPLSNFGKLRLWELEEFDRVVFLDGDTLVLQNVDRLLAYPEFCGAPNVYESLDDFGRLNSGVFTLQPNRRTFDRMLGLLDAPGRFWRRTDQTFLQEFFPAWHGLPVFDNLLQYVYFNLPGLWQWRQIRVLHFQYEKPWQADHPKADLLRPLIDLWWQIHDGRPVTPILEPGARTP